MDSIMVRSVICPGASGAAQDVRLEVQGCCPDKLVYAVLSQVNLKNPRIFRLPCNFLNHWQRVTPFTRSTRLHNAAADIQTTCRLNSIHTGAFPVRKTAESHRLKLGIGVRYTKTMEAKQHLALANRLFRVYDDVDVGAIGELLSEDVHFEHHSRF